MRIPPRLLHWIRRSSPPRDIVLTVIGALVGWGISHLYYVRALNDMKSDVEERRRVEELVFRGIESIGQINYHRDLSGRVVGVAIELRGNASGQAIGAGTLGEALPPSSSREQ